MTTLAVSRTILSALESGPVPPRLLGLRRLMGRMAAAAQADTARRSMAHMPDRLLQDIGLTRGDIHVLDL